jgi:hypothetical protein
LLNPRIQGTTEVIHQNLQFLFSHYDNPFAAKAVDGIEAKFEKGF